jgi:hypothetical protein
VYYFSLRQIRESLHENAIGLGTITPATFFPVRALYTDMTAPTPFKTTLIAPCGMNCAICMAFLREKNRCGGCYAPDRLCSINCTISSCDKVKGRYHHTCSNFPCKRLKQLDTRYRTKYHMSMIENLDAIKRDGIRSFVKGERERWSCKTCGGTIDVHHYRCSVCGKEPE